MVNFCIRRNPIAILLSPFVGPKILFFNNSYLKYTSKHFVKFKPTLYTYFAAKAYDLAVKKGIEPIIFPQ